MSISLKKLKLMGQDLRLLFIDDDTKARKKTLNILDEVFNNVTTAINGEDGLDKFSNSEFDFILSDIDVTTADNLNVLKIIRNKNKNIPILILSSLLAPKYFLQAIKLEVDAYVLKSLMDTQLTRALNKVIKKINSFAISENYHKTLEFEVKKRNAEIEHKLNYDALTELRSRYAFFTDIAKLNLPVVILIDIDKFKIINEVYGNEIGSMLLKIFADKLSLLFDEDKYLLYRMSADEFAVVDATKYIDTDKYETLIEKLFKHLNNLKIEINNNIITVDITIGLSTAETNCYESAKIALDHAKKNKKPYMMYTMAIDDRKESSLTLKRRDDITLAIDEQRVVAVFQPIVDNLGKIIKYETLMRLKEEDGPKLIAPYHFLNVAIKTRLYDYLSSTIIFKALHILSISNHVLSINFTYSDIKNSLFIEQIEDYIIAHEGIGSRAIFEIVENESMENYTGVKHFINRFRKHGVRVAIDDFGSGFSNFQHILEIKPDYLKIDGSLVKKIDVNHDSLALVEAIVEFSHKLGIKVIAEYVHSKKIFEILKELNVDEYQGFYFSEPLENI